MIWQMADPCIGYHLQTETINIKMRNVKIQKHDAQNGLLEKIDQIHLNITSSIHEWVGLDEDNSKGRNMNIMHIKGDVYTFSK